MNKNTFLKSFKVCAKALAAIVAFLMLWDVGLMCAVMGHCRASMISSYAILIAAILPVSAGLSFLYLLFLPVYAFLQRTRLLIPVAIVVSAAVLYFWWSEILSYWPLLIVFLIFGAVRNKYQHRTGNTEHHADAPYDRFALSDEEIIDRQHYQKHEEEREAAIMAQRVEQKEWNDNEFKN